MEKGFNRGGGRRVEMNENLAWLIVSTSGYMDKDATCILPSSFRREVRHFAEHVIQFPGEANHAAVPLQDSVS